MKKGQNGDGVLMPISGKMEYADMVASLLPLLKFQASKITLLHVVQAPVQTPLDAPELADIVASVNEPIENLADWLRKQNYNVDVKIITARSIVDAIVDEANTSEYSFVFMMKRRMTRGIRSFFSKSVTQHVIKHVEVPVISVLV